MINTHFHVILFGFTDDKDNLFPPCVPTFFHFFLLPSHYISFSLVCLTDVPSSISKSSLHPIPYTFTTVLAHLPTPHFHPSFPSPKFNLYMSNILSCNSRLIIKCALNKSWRLTFPVTWDCLGCIEFFSCFPHGLECFFRWNYHPLCIQIPLGSRDLEKF